MGCCCSSSSNDKKGVDGAHLNHSRNQSNWDEINPDIGIVTIPLLTCNDKAGQKCEVYGVIVPLQIFTKSAKNGTYRDKMCVESINMINLTYDERLAVVYTVPKIIKGYMGNEVPKRIKITPEDLIVKRRDRSNPNAGEGDDATVGTISLAGNSIAPLLAMKAAAAAANGNGNAIHQDIQNPIQAASSSSPLTTNGASAVAIAGGAATAAGTTAAAVGDSNSSPRPAETTTPTGSITKPKSKSRPDADKDVVLCTRVWASKRGAGAVSLMGSRTQYHFVLDNGMLRYYESSLDYSPYGTNLKGSIFLAGCRFFGSTTEKSIVLERLGLKTWHIIFADKAVTEKWISLVQLHLEYANTHPYCDLSKQDNENLPKNTGKKLLGIF